MVTTLLFLFNSHMLFDSDGCYIILSETAVMDKYLMLCLLNVVTALIVIIRIWCVAFEIISVLYALYIIVYVVNLDFVL